MMLLAPRTGEVRVLLVVDGAVVVGEQQQAAVGEEGAQPVHVAEPRLATTLQQTNQRLLRALKPVHHGAQDVRSERV
jgi:hypothetical protein